MDAIIQEIHTYWTALHLLAQSKIVVGGRQASQVLRCFVPSHAILEHLDSHGCL